MGQTLLAYQVFRGTKVAQHVNDGELDCPAVPVDNTWRVEAVAVGVFTNGYDYFQQGGPPAAYLFDQTPVGPATLPIQGTFLNRYTKAVPYPLTSGTAVLWADWFDLGSPLTIPGGNQLAVVIGPVAQPGDAIYVRVQYSLWQGSAGQPQPYAGGEPAPAIPLGI